MVTAEPFMEIPIVDGGFPALADTTSPHVAGRLRGHTDKDLAEEVAVIERILPCRRRRGGSVATAAAGGDDVALRPRGRGQGAAKAGASAEGGDVALRPRGNGEERRLLLLWSVMSP